MSERRDDTTEPRGESRGSYYYDDATGYETFDPAEDDDEEGGNEGREGGAEGAEGAGPSGGAGARRQG